MSECDEAEATLAAWAADATAFVRDNFAAAPDKWQLRALEAASRGAMRIAMKACKGPGKTAVLAWLVWWFLSTRPHAKGAAVSITEDNLRDNLWAELAKWRLASPFLLHSFEWTASRVFAVDHPDTWFVSARTWPKSGDAQAQADTLAGIHADHVIFVLDESGGIPSAVMATAEAGLANAGHEGRTALLVQAGNPTVCEGPLFDAFGAHAGSWERIEITGDPDDPERSPRVSREWALEQIARFGRESPWVLVNVFGRFPPVQSNKLLGPDDITVSVARKFFEHEYREEVKVLGVDVARFGDDASVAMLRQGRVLRTKTAAGVPWEWRGLDTMALAAQVSLIITEEEPDAVFVDVTGVGAGVVDRLHQLGYREVVTGVEFGSKPLGLSPIRYVNRRCEMWGLMAEWVRGAGQLPESAELRSQLTAPTYWITRADAFMVETKEEVKKRTGASPDHADALGLTFADRVASRAVREWQKRRSTKATHCKTEYDPHARR